MNSQFGLVVAVIVLSYFLGAIPTAYVVGRLRNVNIFEVGSGNMGATNISRSLGLAWGILVWIVDSLKGIVAILLSVHILPSNPALASTLAAIASVIGHNWSAIVALITGTLRGGKGASTAWGTLLIIAPVQALVGFLVALAVVIATRFVSLGVLVMFSLVTLWTLVLIAQGVVAPIYTLYFVVIAGLIFIRFRENIDRLLRGTERKLGERT
ncbi:MAG: glycerol-3-phosphate acyltransferase [Anaerolineae bacterium]|nr:glycerol-3-phosphate acyltransferase [Anaerolineae bacterium]